MFPLLPLSGLYPAWLYMAKGAPWAFEIPIREGALNARMYGQSLYSVSESGELTARPATSDGGKWLDADAIPESLIPVLGVFFEEMWPVLKSAAGRLTDLIASDEHAAGGELPGKTFTATPGFEALQTGDGPLTHAFEIGGIRGRRMVVPYQIWMLQRVERALERCTASENGKKSVEELLARFEGGTELLDLEAVLAGCRVRKERSLLFAEN